MKKLIAFLIVITVFLLLTQPAYAFTVTLGWEASTSPDVAYYTIHWGTQPGVYDYQVEAGNNLEGSVTNLVDGTMYYFAVSCTDIEGLQSGYSNEVFCDNQTVVPDDNPPFAPDGCYIKSVTS